MTTRHRKAEQPMRAFAVPSQSLNPLKTARRKAERKKKRVLRQIISTGREAGNDFGVMRGKRLCVTRIIDRKSTQVIEIREPSFPRPASAKAAAGCTWHMAWRSLGEAGTRESSCFELQRQTEINERQFYQTLSVPRVVSQLLKVASPAQAGALKWLKIKVPAFAGKAVLAGFSNSESGLLFISVVFCLFWIPASRRASAGAAGRGNDGFG